MHQPILYPRILYVLIVFLAAFCPFAGSAQNLVSNPGFEDYYSCPQSISEVPYAGSTYGVKNWTVNGPGSSDYYNTCGAPIVGVPSNYFGYQPAHGGNAYVGCYTMLYYLMPQLDTYREYVETQLTSPLQQNHLYYVSFYVSTAASAGNIWMQGANFSFWATDGVGAYLSRNYVTGLNLFAYTPQVQQPAGQILSDTAGWTLVSGFVAGNGEQYITLGNFKNYQQMNKSPVVQATGSPGAWYDTMSYVYMDDVSVVPVAIATNDTVICDTAGFSKLLQAYPGGTAYLWNTGDTTSQITVHDTGVYAYQVYFGNTLIRDTIRIHYQAAAQQVHGLFPDTAICDGSSVTVKAPAGFDTYNWYANGNVYHSQTVHIYTGGTVVLQVANACGTMADTFEVRSIQQHPLTTHLPDTTVCAGTVLTFQAPPGYLSYQWQTAGQVMTGASVTIAQPGMVVLRVTDSCTAYTDTFMVYHQPPRLLPHQSDTTICNGAAVLFAAPPGYSTYQWQYNGNIYPVQSITVHTAGKIVLQVTDICGIQSDSFMVGYKSLHPLTDTLPDTAFCSGKQLVLAAPAGYQSYAWVYDGGASSSSQISIASGGIYILQVKDSCALYADSFYVREKPLPLPPLTADTSLCHGAVPVHLPVTGTHLLWYTSPTDLYGTAVLPSLPAGLPEVYIYVTQTADGCESDKAPVHIRFLDVPQIRLPADTIYCQGDYVRLGYEDSMADTYRWSTGQTTAFIVPAAPGIYELTASNVCGAATAATRVAIVPCDNCFWEPDAFTPNGDGRNDFFGPVQTCPAHFHHYLFRVYNRWGQLLFESLTPGQKWDGSFAGTQQPLGTYSYTIEYRSTATMPLARIKGTVELVR